FPTPRRLSGRLPAWRRALRRGGALELLPAPHRRRKPRHAARVDACPRPDVLPRAYARTDRRGPGSRLRRGGRTVAGEPPVRPADAAYDRSRRLAGPSRCARYRRLAEGL